jgi:hypothetical protein
MYLPSFFVDYCQGLIGNQISWNNVITEKKLFHVNDEVILSDEFTADEMLDIQYKMGNMFEYLLNRKNYHHPASYSLVLAKESIQNKSLVLKHKKRLTGKIKYIYKPFIRFSKDSLLEELVSRDYSLF